ncbi:MAG: GNAT family N-acetyltransferase [Sneathiella sp.]
MTARRTVPEITFSRLTEIDPAEITSHMTDPRLRLHMPLLKGVWMPHKTTDFINAKETCWRRDGLGHWAILADHQYAGWGGFQKEGEEWDYALVLKPAHFGLGLQITRQALSFARKEARIASVMFLLPPSRTKLAALKRLGAKYVGKIDYEGEIFLKYLLETDS